MMAAAGVAAAAAICMAGYTAGRYGAYNSGRETAETERGKIRLEMERFLV